MPRSRLLNLTLQFKKKESRFLERWNILGLGQRKPKVSLEHLVVLESKKGGGNVLQGHSTPLEKLPVAKSWASLSGKVKNDSIVSRCKEY